MSPPDLNQLLEDPSWLSDGDDDDPAEDTKPSISDDGNCGGFKVELDENADDWLSPNYALEHEKSKKSGMPEDAHLFLSCEDMPNDGDRVTSFSDDITQDATPCDK